MRFSEGGLRHDALMFRPLPSDLERSLFFSSEQIVDCYWLNLPRTGKYDWRFVRKPSKRSHSEVVVRTSFGLPFCIDWLPDGRLLIVAGRESLLLRRESDGTLVTHADLRSLSEKTWNEIVVDGRCNAYVNGFPGSSLWSHPIVRLDGWPMVSPFPMAWP